VGFVVTGLRVGDIVALVGANALEGVDEVEGVAVLGVLLGESEVGLWLAMTTVVVHSSTHSVSSVRTPAGMVNNPVCLRFSSRSKTKKIAHCICIPVEKIGTGEQRIDAEMYAIREELHRR
jgi:hypothetical protein